MGFEHAKLSWHHQYNLIMNRRWFLSGVLGAFVLTFGCRTVNRDANALHVINSRNQSATILVPGLKTNLKFMQITDAHISVSVDRETNMMKYAARMHKAYTGAKRHFSQDTNKTTFEYLDDVLQKAKQEHVELLLLTGDIVNFPSAASVEYVCDRLKKTGIPWLYIAGNHDWHYEGLEGSLELLRTTWIEKSLLPLYQGRNPLFYSEAINGINFVGIDDSTGKVSQEQIEFLEEQLKRKEPIILLSHIPYDIGGEGKPITMAGFVQTLLANRNKIVGIFTGHNHHAAFSFTGSMCQYVSLPCFQGACFVVAIKAMDPAQSTGEPR
jgi:predicted MPP superfamily phosphohydrolase